MRKSVSSTILELDCDDALVGFFNAEGAEAAQRSRRMRVDVPSGETWDYPRIARMFAEG